jgi:hypothetical protein
MAGVRHRPLLFDLCLDLFNRDDNKMYEGTLWTDSRHGAKTGHISTHRPLHEG